MKSNGWYKRVKTSKEIFIYTTVISFLVFVIFPLFWMFISSIKPAGIVFSTPPVWIFKPTLDNYVEAIGGGTRGWGADIPKYFINSLVVAVVVTLSNMIIGSTAGYGMARYKIGKDVLPLTFLIGKMLPAMVLILPFFLLIKQVSLSNSIFSLILAYTAINLPFCVWMSWSFFLDFPDEIEEASMIDGCNKLQSVVKVIIPLVIPGLISISILVYVACWNEFLFASTIAGMNARTLPVAASLFITDEAILWGPMTATSMIIMIVPALITLFLQKYIVSGLSLGALNG